MDTSKITNFLDKNSIKIAIYTLIFGIIIIILFLFIKPFNDHSYSRNPELFGQYGDFIGGFIGTLFSLVAVLLLYKTLTSQQDAFEKQENAIKQQEIAFNIQNFETTFFNLLKTQQEISNNIKARFFRLDADTFKPISKKREARDFFVNSKVDISRILMSIEHETYLSYYNTYSIDYAFANSGAIDYKIESLKYINSIYSINKSIWTEAKNKSSREKLEITYGIFFQKYHYAIGHYFRHLYHIIKYVDEADIQLLGLTFSKSKYTGFIQSQMSTYELMLLYYNAISFPKLMELLVEHNFLENLTIEDLIDESHNCIDGIVLKRRKDLIKRNQL